jgi:hypothetical protein
LEFILNDIKMFISTICYDNVDYDFLGCSSIENVLGLCMFFSFQ